MSRISIILANLMSARGELNNETIARLNLAAELERSQEADLVLLCGWDYRPDCDIAIADAMRKYLLVHHPRLAKKGICQRLSRDTVGDAVFSRIWLDELFGNHGPHTLSVMTSEYHVNRTKKLFEFAFGDHHPITVNGAPGFDSSDLADKEEKSLAAFRKTFSGVPPGNIKSIYCSLRNNHPFYNGTVYPKIGCFHEVAQELKNSRDNP